MGVFALAVLWVNTLLVAAAALQRFRALSAKRAALVPAEPRAGATGLFFGRLGAREGATVDGVVARRAIDQVGRYGSGEGRSILWHDRHYCSEVLGGTLAVGDVTLDIGAAASAEAWTTDEAVESAAICTSSAAFDAAFEKARKAKGFLRTVDVPIRAGQDAWVAGTIVATDGGLEIRAAEGQPLLVSTLEPRAWLSRKALFLAAFFVPAVLAGAAVSTALALATPRFGTVSMVGAGLGFLYFLLVLPAGTAARDAVREPHEKILRGKWTDPSGVKVGAGSDALDAAR
jgi:hypothetical protein